MSDLHDCNQCKFTDGSEVSKRVCAECFDKTSWEPKPTVYTVDIDLDVQTRINLNPCPLPRIGSNEWGWKWDKQTEKYKSQQCKYWLDPSGASDGASELFEVMFQGEHHPCTVGSYMLLPDAKRFAELLARRDWRRENRGKR